MDQVFRQRRERQRLKPSSFQNFNPFFHTSFNLLSDFLPKVYLLIINVAIQGVTLPVFRTKKEAFEWLSSGKKTIDVRKGDQFRGEFAVYLSGRNVLRMKIVKRETGKLDEVVRSDNYRLVIPSALFLDDALAYLRGLYVEYNGIFCAYYVVPLES